jgi:hypothetical protein
MATVVVVPSLAAAVPLLLAAVTAAAVPLLLLLLLLVVVDNVDKLQVRGFGLSPPGWSRISVDTVHSGGTSPVLLVKIWRAGGQLLLVVA